MQIMQNCEIMQIGESICTKTSRTDCAKLGKHYMQVCLPRGRAWMAGPPMAGAVAEAWTVEEALPAQSKQ